MVDGVRRCPRCNDVWPASAPRCLSCRYGAGESGPRPSAANVLIFALAVAGGIGFVVFHNQRRRQEHPPLPSVTTAQPAPAEAKKPPKIRACTFTSPDLDRLLGPAKLAALDSCKASGARVQLGLDQAGQVVGLDSSLPDETRRCVATAFGVTLPSTTEPLMVCSYQLK